jgi:iron(III) transport system substrate-binding protein
MSLLPRSCSIWLQQTAGIALCLLLVTLMPATARGSEPLVVYSARNEQLIKPLFDAYTRETGVPIRYITGDAAVLTQRLAAEGRSTPADVLMTVDAGELWNAADRGLLRPLSSSVLDANVPASLRDPQRRWFGLSQRARTIFYAPGRVDPRQLSSYEALAAPQWKGRLCLRTSKKVYNQSLVAMLIAAEGEAGTERIVRGWVANLAAPPFANDNQVLEAIAAGQCDVGIVNTYYYGRILRDRPDFPVKPFWADQGGSGVHVNVSGAGVTRHSRRPAEAQRLLEWLSSGNAQQQFAALNMEYPVNPAIRTDALVQSWGVFRASPLNVAEAGRLQPAAVRLMDRAGYR